MVGAGDSTAWGGITAESVASPSPNQGVQATQSASARPRSRCSPRLTRSVDMTSDVKGWEELFYVCLMFFPLSHRKSRSQEDTTVDHAAIRGLAPTFLASVGCLPHARDERTLRPPNAAEGYTTPGLRLCRETLETLESLVL